MILTRNELATLLNVKERYLCPSNLDHVKNGARQKGYNLLSMKGRGINATYELEPIYTEVPGEEWKNFPLAPDYQISTHGRIKHPNGGILTGTKNRGYVRTRIQGLGQFPNHRAVMLTFAPISNPENYVVDHIDGRRDNNNLSNLRWVFQSENMTFRDENNTELKEIIGQLVQKYGYSELKEQLLALLE